MYFISLQGGYFIPQWNLSSSLFASRNKYFVLPPSPVFAPAISIKYAGWCYANSGQCVSIIHTLCTRRVPGGARKNRLRLACGTCGQQYVRSFYGSGDRPTIVARTSESYVFDYRQRGLHCCAPCKFTAWWIAMVCRGNVVRFRSFPFFFLNSALLWSRSFSAGNYSDDVSPRSLSNFPPRALFVRINQILYSFISSCVFASLHVVQTRHD